MVYDFNGNPVYPVYDVEENVLSSVYDVNGNVLDGETFADETTITDVYTPTVERHVQGGCVDDEGNIYACLYTSGKFLKYNLTTGLETVITPSQASGSQPWGHANGMTYNPNTEYIYAASMKNTGEVYVFNKSCELVNTLYAKNTSDIAFNCWNICYDRLTERFITLSGGVIYFFDDNFDLVTTGSYNVSDWEETRQDIETDGTFIYCISWNTNKIFVFDMNGHRVAIITNTAFTGEPESMCYDWENEVYYIEGMENTNSYYVIRQAEFIES